MNFVHSFFKMNRQKFSHENKTWTNGYCRTRIDQHTKIHLDVSICITRDETTQTSTTNQYALLDRIEHIGMTNIFFPSQKIEIFQIAS